MDILKALEPKEMGREEMKAFEKMSADSYRETMVAVNRTPFPRNVDKIIILDKGEVAGIGTHDYLMQNCELYQRLIKNQILSF